MLAEPVADDTTIKATIEAPTAAGPSVRIRTVGGAAKLVVRGADTGERCVVRDPGAWTALVHAGTAAGFDFDDGWVQAVYEQPPSRGRHSYDPEVDALLDAPPLRQETRLRFVGVYEWAHQDSNQNR